jgi:hypothetical protein
VESSGDVLGFSHLSRAHHSTGLRDTDTAADHLAVTPTRQPITWPSRAARIADRRNRRVGPAMGAA